MMTADQILKKYGGSQSNTNGSAFSTLGSVQPGSMTSEQLLKRYGSQNQQPTQSQEPTDIFGTAANAINSTYEAYKNAPGIKQARQLVGGVVGLGGGILGGITGAIGNPIANVAQGKPVFENFGRDVVNTAKDTAKFGFDIGSEGAAAAPLGGAGKLISIPLTYAQGYQGAKDIKEGYKSGDNAQLFQGGLELATSFLGAKSALKSKGLIINKDIFPKSTEKILTKAEDLAHRDLNIPKSQQKKITLKGAAANQAGKEYTSPVRTMLEEGLYPERKMQGGRPVFDITKSLDEVQQREKLANEVFETRLRQNDPNPKHDLLSLKQRAVASVSENSPVATQRSRAEIANYFDQAIDQNGQFVDDALLNRLKRGLYEDGYNADSSPTKGGSAYRSSGNILMKEIEAKNPTLNVREVNQVLGRFAELRKFLPSLQGNVAQGGMLARQVSGILGALAGRSTGIPILGEILGYKTGEYLQTLSAMSEKNANEIANLLNGIKPRSTKTISNFSTIAEQSARARAERKLLPAPAKTLASGLDVSGISPQSEAAALVNTQRFGNTLRSGPQPGVRLLGPAQSIQLSGRSITQPSRLQVTDPSFLISKVDPATLESRTVKVYPKTSKLKNAK